MPTTKRDHDQDKAQRAEAANPEDRTSMAAMVKDVRRDQDQARTTAQPAQRRELDQRLDLLQKAAELVERKTAQAVVAPDQTAERAQEQQAVRAAVETVTQAQRAELDLRHAREDQARSIITNAMTALDAQQQDERTRAAKSPAADQTRLAEHQQRQRDDLANVADLATQRLRELETGQSAHMQQSRIELSSALLAPEPGKAVAAAAERNTAGAKEDATLRRQAVRALARQANEIVGRLAPQDADQLRQQLADKAPAVAKLSDAGLARALDEGRRNPEDSRNGAIKGQLVEETLRAREEQRIATSNGAKEQFLPGNDVRNAQGQKLTDGLLVRRIEEGRLALIKAWEAKAGEFSARDLTARTSKLTGPGVKEIEKYAQDLARRDLLAKEQLQGAPATEAAMAAAHASIEADRAKDAAAVARAEIAAGKRNEQELASLASLHADELRAAEEEAGQLVNTTERLAESADAVARIFVNGKPEQLEREAKVQDLVKGIVPRGVANDATAEELDVEEEQFIAASRILAAAIEEEEEEEH